MIFFFKLGHEKDANFFGSEDFAFYELKVNIYDKKTQIFFFWIFNQGKSKL